MADFKEYRTQASIIVGAFLAGLLAASTGASWTGAIAVAALTGAGIYTERLRAQGRKTALSSNDLEIEDLTSDSSMASLAFLLNKDFLIEEISFKNGLLVDQKERLIGKKVFDFLPNLADDFDQNSPRVSDFRGSNLVFKLPSYLAPNASDNWFEAHISPVKRDKILLTLIDVTHYRMAEERSKREYQTIKDAFDLKTNFLYAMSHEIRTPVNAIVGFADLLKEQTLEPNVANQLSQIRIASHNLLLLIDDLLNLSRLEAEDLGQDAKVFDLAETVEMIIEPMNADIELVERAPIHFKSEAMNSMVKADQKLITQLIQSLLNQSVLNGGHEPIEVYLQEKGEFDPSVFQITIKDNLSNEAAKKSYEVLSQFRMDAGLSVKVQDGNPLGLAIAMEISKILNGTLEIGTDKKGRNQFVLTLPLNKQENLRTNPQNSQTKTVSERRIRVLVAEDNAVNQALMRALLEKSDMDMKIVENGKLACHEIQQIGGYDIVLMDIQMPVMDGTTAVKTIREWETANGLAPLPIVAVTANVVSGKVEEAMKVGFDAYLGKPIRRGKLLDVIHSFVKEGTPKKSA